MDINDIITLVSGTGFPVAMCVMMFYYMKDRDTKMTESFDKLTEAFIELKAIINEKLR